MTVPHNYNMPPDRRQTPGHRSQWQYGGPSGSPESEPRNYTLLGAIVVGCTVLTLGSILLVTFMVNRDGDEKPDASENLSSEAETTPAGEEETASEDEETAPVVEGEEIGHCLPYDPTTMGDGLELLASCDDAAAFWKITDQSYDVDVGVDAEGNLNDDQPAYDLCGEGFGVFEPGAPLSTWQWVYSEGRVDSMYCVEAIGNPTPEGYLPYTPDEGDCFVDLDPSRDSDPLWTVPCSSSDAEYKVTKTVPVYIQQELTAEEAEGIAFCESDGLWQLVNTDNETTSILCGDEV